MRFRRLHSLALAADRVRGNSKPSDQAYVYVLVLALARNFANSPLLSRPNHAYVLSPLSCVARADADILQIGQRVQKNSLPLVSQKKSKGTQNQ